METEKSPETAPNVPPGAMPASARIADDDAGLDRLIQDRIKAVWRELDQEEQARGAA